MTRIRDIGSDSDIREGVREAVNRLNDVADKVASTALPMVAPDADIDGIRASLAALTVRVNRIESLLRGDG